jgi:hypothetical protein
MANNLSGISYSSNFNNLDGLSVIEADQIYIDGKLIDLDNLVPYTGATQAINAGSFPVQSSHVPSTGNDLVNFTTLVSAITNQDTTNQATFLDKITTTAQTVQASTTYLNGLSVSDDRPTHISSRLEVDANYQTLLSSADVSVGQGFGSISNVGSVYQATSTNTASPPILVLFPIVSGQRYTLQIEVLGDDSTYDTTLDIYQSDDGVSPFPNYNDAVLDSPLFAPASTVFHQTNASFISTTNGFVVLNLTTSNPSGISTVKWRNLSTFEMGVSLTNATYPSLTPDRVPIINDKHQLVASGINSTKLGYLDNVSSDIQTQLNARVLKAGDTMTGALDMGANKITTTYTPVNGEDVLNKTYGDATYVSSGALSGYLPLTGGTLTGALTVQTTINTSISGINANVTPALNLVSTANHFNSAAAQTYLFNAPSGEIQLSYSTTRNATTATLLLGAPSTDISEIVSISGDGTTNLPMSFLASRYAFLTGNVGIGTTDPRDSLHVHKNNAYASRAANPLPSNIIASSASQRLYMGSYYTLGAGSCATIQSSDYYTDPDSVARDHGKNLLINPLGGYVGIGGGDPSAPLTVNGSITIRNGTNIYEAGCIYTDVNWGMLFRGAVNANVAHMRWDRSDGTMLMKIHNTGVLNFTGGGTNYAVEYNQTTRQGAVVIGNINTNYGGGWQAGLLFECQDTTEITCHDSGNRLTSFMYYDGGNRLYIGRDIGFGTTPVFFGTDISTPRTYFSGTSTCSIYNGNIDTYNPTGNNNLMIQSWWGLGFQSYDGGVRIAFDTRTGESSFGGRMTLQGTPIYPRFHKFFTVMEYNGNWNGYTKSSFISFSVPCRVYFTGTCTFYASSVANGYGYVRMTNTATGVFYNYPVNKYFNIINNHETVGISYWLDLTPGTYDLYCYAAFNCNVDINDQMNIIAFAVQGSS